MKIAVIGAGNMGGAIAEGAVKKGVVSASGIMVADPFSVLADRLGKEGIEVGYTKNNAEAAKAADLVIVAVKPWLMEGVMAEIAPVLDRRRQAVVSIAAGVTFSRLEEYLSVEKLGAVGLYRVIPNTAISLGKSVTFIARHGTSEAHDKQITTLFEALGDVFDVEESEMAACTALSSSGIAYALKYIDASMRGGGKLGIEKAKSLKIVIKTIAGALALLEANDTDPQTEIDKVTTPGGITLKGLDAMEKDGFSEAVIKGLLATK